MKFRTLHLWQLGVLLLLNWAPAVLAHDVRPAYLGLEEIESRDWGSTFDVIWKQPLINDKRLRMDPILPSGCVATDSAVDEVLPGALLRRWQVHCTKQAFEQEPIGIQGLSSTLTDVWFNAKQLNGNQLSTVLTPSEPSVWMNRSQGTHLSAYLSLGVEHLLFGFDHILFIIGLMFFVTGFSSLLKTVTAFTLAHSITLAASSLNLVHLSQRPVEAAIALSILFLAFEASLPGRAQRLPARLPWVIAFIFGLLHGFGFAGALRDIGLPADSAGLALLLFNLGVEIGQVLVIVAILASLALFRTCLDRLPPPLSRSLARTSTQTGLRLLSQMPVYVMGSLACFWFLQRLVPILGL